MAFSDADVCMYLEDLDLAAKVWGDCSWVEVELWWPPAVPTLMSSCSGGISFWRSKNAR